MLLWLLYNPIIDALSSNKKENFFHRKTIPESVGTQITLFRVIN
jgi:hypothetical protein